MAVVKPAFGHNEDIRPGYRVIWVRSSSEAASDAASHAARIEAGFAGVEEVRARLESPKTRRKTEVAAEDAVKAALAGAGATRWVDCTVAGSTVTDYRQETRGRPGSATLYRRTDKGVFSDAAKVNAEIVSYEAATDGCFPLITSDTEMAPAAVCAAYRYQPNLERRHHMLKGPQLVAPVFLESPQRIEALLLCRSLARLADALIEREARVSMTAKSLAGIRLCPELRNCPAPNTPRMLEIFSGVQRHCLMSGDDVVQVFEPQPTPLRLKVLDLLHVPAVAYASVAER